MKLASSLQETLPLIYPSQNPIACSLLRIGSSPPPPPPCPSLTWSIGFLFPPDTCLPPVGLKEALLANRVQDSHLPKNVHNNDNKSDKKWIFKASHLGMSRGPKRRIWGGKWWNLLPMRVIIIIIIIYNITLYYYYIIIIIIIIIIIYWRLISNEIDIIMCKISVWMCTLKLNEHNLSKFVVTAFVLYSRPNVLGLILSFIVFCLFLLLF